MEIKLEQIWQGLSTAIVVLDQHLVVKFANASCSELFGLSVKRLLNQPLNHVFSHHQINFQRLEHYVLGEGVDCQQHRVDVVFVDNRSATLNLYARLLKHQSQRFILLECRRIDDEVRFDQASNQQHQFHAARNLIRGLAHEIKNPLGGIRGAAQLMQYDMDSQERQECAQVIIEQADRLRELVDRLLGPNQLPQRAACNIHETLESVLTLCQFDQVKRVQLIKDYDPSIPDIVIDKSQIQQVVLNIVRNAQQAIQAEGIIKVTTRIKHGLQHGQRRIKQALLIRIADNGPGIDANLRDTLFFPMVSSKDDGSGLGLSIAQTLVEQHNGFIQCDSWPGHTEFSIYLPFQLTPEGEIE